MYLGKPFELYSVQWHYISLFSIILLKSNNIVHEFYVLKSYTYTAKLI